MRAVVQRVSEASVRVDGDLVGRIGPGLCVLVGVSHTDNPESARAMASKLWHLRIFNDAAGVMNLAVRDVGGQVLVVSQFTLYGDTERGRRPSWAGAVPAADAAPIVDEVTEELSRLGAAVQTGRFGARMQVHLVDEGPVTLIFET
jgi:D-aminoacyl-tRNA deacylase